MSTIFLPSLRQPSSGSKRSVMLPILMRTVPGVKDELSKTPIINGKINGT